ncbi:hypothetical protein [Desertivirga brevis]|uniref:hypothetical protein n=1 Tax=Desertivirga brevis TaxID=2810310 RepID=UPI001A96E2DF|nr:hypothetical protein [Pedobacter sp. SYSU D00873]
MEDEKDRHNHTGQTPSNVPSEKLINPPKRNNLKKKIDRRSDFNSTAKDPNLGNRNNTGR